MECSIIMKYVKTIHLIRQFILLLLSLLTINYGYTASAQDKFDEYMVKAAFTMNFARLTQWPEKRLKASEAINICVMGNETLKSTFTLVKGKNINGHTARLNIISRLNMIKQCHILFISGIKQSNMRQIFKLAQQHSILTISELPDIGQSHAILNFIMHRHKVRFQIDPEKAQQAGLKISSRLLKLAIIKKSIANRP